MLNNIAKYSSLAIPYSVLISIIHLFGYWSAFDIDFYSYISAQELAIRSIPPFIYVGISSFLGFFCKKSGNNPTNSKIDKIDIILMLLTFLFFCLILIYFNTYRYIVYSIIIFLLIAIYLKFTDNFIIFKESKILFYLLILLPILVYAHGRTESEKIIQGKSYKYFIASSNELLITHIGENKRYVGKIGDYVFIYISSDQSILITELNKITPFVILKHPSTQNQNATLNATQPRVTLE